MAKFAGPDREALAIPVVDDAARRKVHQQRPHLGKRYPEKLRNIGHLHSSRTPDGQCGEDVNRGRPDQSTKCGPCRVEEGSAQNHALEIPLIPIDAEMGEGDCKSRTTLSLIEDLINQM